MANALTQLAESYGISVLADPVDLPDVHPIESTSVDMAELGVTGTRFYTGQVAIEPSASYRPSSVRGKSGNPRLYEEYYRGEPLILDAVQSYTELLVAGRYDLPVPEETPDAMRDDVQAFCDFYRAALMNVEGGWLRFIEHAASKLVFGFALFEIVWDADDEGRPFPRKLAFREQNTVENWILGERGDNLVAVQFRTGGNNPKYYTIPASKLLLANLNARGNNFEGIPPIRPAIHWIKTKRILAQIAALSAEKYGVPIGVVQKDTSVEDGFGGTDQGQRTALREVISVMRSAEGPVVEIPDGLIFDLKSPPGTMPDLMALIQYCDQMITAAFSNEGSLLGLQSQVGSYALGEQKERDFLRSAPYYARKTLQPINDMLRALARDWFGDAMPPVCPQMVYRVDGMKDSSRWLDDVNKLLPNGEWRQIPEVAKAVYQELGLDVAPENIEAAAQLPRTKPVNDIGGSDE